MSIQNIEFEDGNIGNVTVKIDNAHDDTLEIKELKKINTYLTIEELDDTALFNDITIQSTLHEGDDTPITNGVVSINIFSKDKQSILLSQQETITEDGIQSIIKNQLSTGTYYVEISYAGTKYYNPSRIGKFIRINKRRLICELTDFEYYVTAGAPATITGTIKDFETHKPVSNCIINYKFNDEINQITTDNIGRINFTVQIPEHGTEDCMGATSKKYEVLINMENASYILPNKSIILITRKDPTSIDIQSKNMTIDGVVLTKDGFAHHGTVDISMYEGRYFQQVEVGEYGNFSHTINMSNVITAIGSNVSDIKVYNLSSDLTTKVLLEAVDTEVEVGDSFTVLARVEDEYQNAVTCGTIDFRLFNSKNKQVYRYITELDNGGMGEFIFYTSKAEVYHVEAYYDTVVGYKPSQSTENIIIEVNNGS